MTVRGTVVVVTDSTVDDKERKAPFQRTSTMQQCNTNNPSVSLTAIGHISGRADWMSDS